MKCSAVIMANGSWFEVDGNYWIPARMVMWATLLLLFLIMWLLLRSYAIWNYCFPCIWELILKVMYLFKLRELC